LHQRGPSERPMPRIRAGLLMYRIKDGALEVLLAHSFASRMKGHGRFSRATLAIVGWHRWPRCPSWLTSSPAPSQSSSRTTTANPGLWTMLPRRGTVFGTGLREPSCLCHRPAVLSLCLTSRTISSIRNGCKRVGSFSSFARHSIKTLSDVFSS
jgi:hypothetical protein